MGLLAAVAIFSLTQRLTLHRGALVAAATAALYVCGLYVVYLSTPLDSDVSSFHIGRQNDGDGQPGSVCQHVLSPLEPRGEGMTRDSGRAPMRWPSREAWLAALLFTGAHDVAGLSPFASSGELSISDRPRRRDRLVPAGVGYARVSSPAVGDLRCQHLLPRAPDARLWREHHRHRVLRRPGHLADRRPAARREHRGHCCRACSAASALTSWPAASG